MSLDFEQVIILALVLFSDPRFGICRISCAPTSALKLALVSSPTSTGDTLDFRVNTLLRYLTHTLVSGHI